LGAIRPRLGEAGLTQDLQVMRQRRLGDGHIEVAATSLAVQSQAAHDVESDRVAQGMQHLGQLDGVDLRVMSRSDRCSTDLELA
jgi:hypothetical protein